MDDHRRGSTAPVAVVVAASGQDVLSWRTSRLRAALNDSASALSARPDRTHRLGHPQLLAQVREIL